MTQLAVWLPLFTAVYPSSYWHHASEKLERRNMYLVSLAAHAIFSALAAVSSSIGMLIAMRMLTSVASVGILHMGAAVIKDIWGSKEKQRAERMYTVGRLLGHFGGPALALWLTRKWGCRTAQWVMVEYGFLGLLLALVLLLETLHSVARQKRTTELKPTQQISSAICFTDLTRICYNTLCEQTLPTHQVFHFVLRKSDNNRSLPFLLPQLPLLTSALPIELPSGGMLAGASSATCNRYNEKFVITNASEHRM